MDNLFTVLIIIGAIASMISKANKNAQKGASGGPGQMNRPPVNGQMPNRAQMNAQMQNRPQMNGSPMRPPAGMPQINGQMQSPQNSGFQNAMPQSPNSFSNTQKEAPIAPKLTEMTAMVDALKPSVKATVVPLTSGGEVIPEDKNYGEGFADEEGTSFGDGSKGTEGECLDEHVHTDLTEKPYEVISSEDNSWDFSEKTLLNAIVYSEVLGKPKSLKHNHR